jgi:predicted nucleic acid-binding protein
MPEHAGTIQYWDTSALLCLILREFRSPVVLEAWKAAKTRFAWDWLQAETLGSLWRRTALHEHLRAADDHLRSFRWFQLQAGDYPDLMKVFETHRLRSADAGHLLCLKRAKKLFPDIEFVCFDDGLAAAAEREGVRVFGRG